MACKTRSGTLVGPGICRKWRPVWAGGWFFLDFCFREPPKKRAGQGGRETAARQAGRHAAAGIAAGIPQIVKPLGAARPSVLVGRETGCLAFSSETEGLFTRAIAT